MYSSTCKLISLNSTTSHLNCSFFLDGFNGKWSACVESSLDPIYPILRYWVAVMTFCDLEMRHRRVLQDVKLTLGKLVLYFVFGF